MLEIVIYKQQYWGKYLINIIYIQPTDDLTIIKDILTIPLLYKVNGNTAPIAEFKVDTSFNYLLIKDNEHIYGCFQYRKFTGILIEGHINIIPEYWGSKVSLEAMKLGIKWLENNTNSHRIFTDVPIICEHVHRLLNHFGFK